MNRRAFLLWAIIALLWANLPYLVGYAPSTSNNRFGGFFLYEQDGYSYLAKMRQGAHGAWTFHLPYTSEDEYQTGGVAYLFYLIIGKIGYSPLIYHAARLLSSILLLVVLRHFVARFISDRRWQLWTWWLLLFSSGWGLLVSYFVDPKYVAYELIAPDAFVFSILYGPPHVIFGFALLLIWIEYTLDSLASDRSQLPRRLIVANVLGGFTALSREAYGPTFAGIFAAYLIAVLIQRRSIPWRDGLIVALSSITAGLYSIYLLMAFRTIPGFVMWSQQNPFTSPSLFDFVLGFAPLLILAIAWFQPSPRPLSLKGRGARGEDIFLIAWLIAGPILAYLPLPISRRLIAGWQIPLCIFGAYTLLRLVQSNRKIVATLVLIAASASTILIIVGGTMRVAAQQPPLFQPADQVAALDWLSSHTTDRDVVLSDWRLGNIIPTVADARVFIGHPIETAAFDDKQVEVNHFFDPATPNVERQAFLARWKITLFVSDSARPFDRAPVFQYGTYSIYRVTP
jgi:hypothetical protein